MTDRHVARFVVRLVAGVVALGSIACANSPTAPTASAPVATAPAAAALPPSAASPWTALAGEAVMPATLAQCLGGSGSASCFSRARVRAAASTSARISGAPVFNNNQPVLNSGATVTLFWTPPPGGSPASYVVEASSTPGGPANLANFNTGNALTTLVVPDVPAGTYYVRIRALDASGEGAASNEVQVVVGGGAAGSCPSAPRGLSVVSQTGGTVTLGWLPPVTGGPASYVIQAGSAPNGSNLANFDTNSTALTLTASNVGAGSYFVRVYARSSGCAPPAFLSAASNETLLSVGAVSSGWSGQIVCRTAITGPGGYHHDETQTWVFGGPGQTVGPRTIYPAQWSAQGAGGGTGKNWTINSTAMTDLSVVIVASTGIPIFDRTTTGIVIRQGIVGTPTSFDLYEMDFATIVAGSPNAASVSGTWGRPTVGGDSPQQPGGSIGSLSCAWSLALR